jgi:DNA-binding CsgD family transcriptional regulator
MSDEPGDREVDLDFSTRLAIATQAEYRAALERARSAAKQEDAGVTESRDHGKAYGLTPRERETLRTFGELHSVKETADRLGIKDSTVKAHLRAARTKMGARDSWEAVDKDSRPEG